MEEESGKCAVYVGNLRQDVTSATVQEMFARFGNITRCSVLEFELNFHFIFH